MKVNLPEKIADWLFDVAKYVITATIITSFLTGFQETWLFYLFGAVVVGGAFLGAIWIINNINKRN